MTAYLLLLTMMTIITKISETQRRTQRAGGRRLYLPQLICCLWCENIIWCGIFFQWLDNLSNDLQGLTLQVITIKFICNFDLKIRNLQYQMSDQPIIIEQSSSKPPAKGHSLPKDSSIFFELMDEVQNYDSLSLRIKRHYDQAMLQFASIKFNNPFALTPNSHRCLPAFLTIKGEALEGGYVPFTQEVNQDEFFEEFEQQQEIEQQCMAKNEQYIKADKEERIRIRENEPLYRYNVLNQQSEVITASNKFQQLLTSLLQLVEAKRHIQHTFNQLQGRKDQK